MSSQTGGIAILLRGLFSETSLFPPADLAMPAALTVHLAHQAAWYREMTGPFACPDTRIGALRLALTAGGVPEIDLSLVVTRGASGLEAALDEVAADPRLRLRAVEVPALGDDGVAELADALDGMLLSGAAAYLEVPLADLTGDALDIVAGHGYRLKLRTGGADADAFPGEDLLAGCLIALADRRLACTCTAGVQHGVRQEASETSAGQHGFLNLLLAVVAALDDADRGTVAAVLADADSRQVAGQAAQLSPDQARMARSMIVSVGTSSTQEPVADLVALGLADPRPAP
jgi:hypothetical protein